jgi:hypothetical protein
MSSIKVIRKFCLFFSTYERTRRIPGMIRLSQANIRKFVHTEHASLPLNSTMMKPKRLFSLILLPILLLAACGDDARVIPFDDSKIYYERTITRVEAAQLGRYLEEAGYFRKGEAQVVHVEKDGLEYQVDWRVERDFRPTPQNLDFFYNLVDSLNANLYKELEVEFRIYLDDYRGHNWPIEGDRPDYIDIAPNLLYYQKEVDQGLASEVAEVIKANANLLSSWSDGAILLLEKVGDEHILSVATPGNIKQEDIKQISELRKALMKDLFKEGIDVEFRGGLLDVVKRTVRGTYYPNSLDADGMEIRFGEDVTWDEVLNVQRYFKYNGLRHADWVILSRTGEGKSARFKLTVPPRLKVDAAWDLRNANKLSVALTQAFEGTPVDVEIYDEERRERRLIKAEDATLDQN